MNGIMSSTEEHITTPSRAAAPQNNENNSKWRRENKDIENVKPKKKIEVYSTSTEILPILEGPETINTSIPSTTPIRPKPCGSVFGGAPIVSSEIKEGFETVDTSEVTNADNISKNPYKWLLDTKKVIFTIIAKNFAQFDPTVITHNKYTDRFLKYLAEKDIANGWLDDASNYVSAVEKKTSESVIAAATEAANSVDSGGVLSQLKNGVKCDNNDNSDKDGDLNIQNPDLALDIALIKDYMFRTIMLIVSFITVSSWAYIFLVYYSKKTSFLAGIIESVISDNSILDFSRIPIIGIFLDVIMKQIIYFLSFFNPFDMATRGISALSDIMKKISNSDMNDTFDKKIWYIFIFYCVFVSTIFFIENYHNYMNDVANLKANNITTFFYVIFILFYIWDVFTYPTKLANMTEMAVGTLIIIPFIIYLIVRNIFTLICLYYNQFLILFVILMLFIGISIGGLCFFPTFNPGKLFVRFDALCKVINTDAGKKIELDALDPSPSIFNKIYRIIRNFLHFFYDHLFSISSVLWILYMYHVFNKNLKNDLLRINVFTMLAVSILILIILKMLELFFVNKRQF